MTRYPLYRRLGGPQSLSGEERKISLPLGLDAPTVQPVTSRNTDYAIPAHPQLPRGFKSVEEKTLKKEEVGCSEILKASFSNSRRYNYEDTTQSDSITAAYTGLAFGVDGGIIQFKVFNT